MGNNPGMMVDPNGTRSKYANDPTEEGNLALLKYHFGNLFGKSIDNAYSGGVSRYGMNNTMLESSGGGGGGSYAFSSLGKALVRLFSKIGNKASSNVEPSTGNSTKEESKEEDEKGEYPDYVMKQVKSKGIIKLTTKSEIPSGTVVLESTSDAWNHYMNGNGEPAVIGQDGLYDFETSREFQYYVYRIITGKTKSMSGYLSVDLELKTFHIGRTNFDYSIKCESGDCTVKFNIFINDGFWDANYLDEFFQIQQPDGMGPNLELRGGKPFKYVPRTIEYKFINPGYPSN